MKINPMDQWYQTRPRQLFEVFKKIMIMCVFKYVYFCVVCSYIIYLWGWGTGYAYGLFPNKYVFLAGWVLAQVPRFSSRKSACNKDCFVVRIEVKVFFPYEQKISGKNKILVKVFFVPFWTKAEYTKIASNHPVLIRAVATAWCELNVKPSRTHELSVGCFPNSFLSFFLGLWILNLITGLSGWMES